MIDRQVIVRLATKVLHQLLVVDLDPAGSGYIDGLELTIDTIFILQTMRDDVELQRADRAEYQIVVS